MSAVAAMAARMGTKLPVPLELPFPAALPSSCLDAVVATAVTAEVASERTAVFVHYAARFTTPAIGRDIGGFSGYSSGEAPLDGNCRPGYSGAALVALRGRVLG